MLKEQGYIEKFSDDMLRKYGLSSNDRNVIKYLTDKAISEKLYTDTLDYQHNLKHVERVIAYARMIMNKINSTINEEILMYAALYHDIGKTLGASNQEHGLVGSEEFKKMMKGIFDDKKIDIISKLIFQHALEEDKIDFTDYGYSIAEQQEIQLMSDILKDADALDRNRLNQPAPIGTCDEKKLRTKEAKQILKISDSFYEDYSKIIIEEREKQSNSKILDNYELLNDWINSYKNGKENMFHASLDPSVDLLRPTESTQKGSYVYAGIDPINCMTMASFRSSTIFPRTKTNGKRAIMEIFPNSIYETLKSKYVTIYRLPNEKFSEYIRPNTSSPHREWISEESVEPIEQVSFKALDLYHYFIKNGELGFVKDYSKKQQMLSFMQSFRMYIWGIASIKENPNIFEKKWEGIKKIVEYYDNNPDTIGILSNFKKDIDNDIQDYIENFKEKNNREPNYSLEEECISPIIEKFENKLYLKNEKGQIIGLNNEYINSLQYENKQSNQEQPKSLEITSVQESKKGFDQRSESEVQIANQIKQKNMAIKQQKEQHRSLNNQKVKTLTKPNNNGGSSSSGYANVVTLALIVSFVAGALSMLIYYICK